MLKWRTDSQRFAVVLAFCLWAVPVWAAPGSISGSVHVSGDVPVLPAQPVYKQLGFCGESVADERLVVGANGALANAVVYLTDAPAAPAPAGSPPVTMDNRKCAFVPHVRSATVGQTLDIHNSDPFLHDAHARIGTETLFNVGILPDHTAHQPLEKTGLIQINCNVRHTWMHAFVYVGANPYHAVSGGDGHFAIEQVPPGTYTLRVWHELLGNVDRPITVESGKATTIDIALPMVAVVPAVEAP